MDRIPLCRKGTSDRSFHGDPSGKTHSLAETPGTWLSGLPRHPSACTALYESEFGQYYIQQALNIGTTADVPTEIKYYPINIKSAIVAKVLDFIDQSPDKNEKVYLCYFGANVLKNLLPVFNDHLKGIKKKHRNDELDKLNASIWLIAIRIMNSLRDGIDEMNWKKVKVSFQSASLLIYQIINSGMAKQYFIQNNIIPKDEN